MQRAAGFSTIWLPPSFHVRSTDCMRELYKWGRTCAIDAASIKRVGLDSLHYVGQVEMLGEEVATDAANGFDPVAVDFEDDASLVPNPVPAISKQVASDWTIFSTYIIDIKICPVLYDK